MTKRTKILVAASLAVFAGVCLIGIFQAWRHPRLPSLLLAEPTAHVVERFGIGDLHHMGPVVIQTGPDVKALHIGPIKAGNSFWIVGGGPSGNMPSDQVSTISEMKRDLKARYGQGGHPSVRVVYHFSRDGEFRSNTQHMELTEFERFVYLFGY